MIDSQNYFPSIVVDNQAPIGPQCPEKEMNKNFENQQRDLCREVQYASEVPKNYLRTLCVIGSPMQIFKKPNFYHCVKILSGNQTKR